MPHLCLQEQLSDTGTKIFLLDLNLLPGPVWHLDPLPGSAPWMVTCKASMHPLNPRVQVGGEVQTEPAGWSVADCV